MTDTDAAIAAFLDARTDEIAGTLSRLVRIPTANPYSGDAAPAGEAAGQRFLEAALRDLGGETRHIPVPDDVYHRAGILGPRARSWAGRENLVARFDFGGGPAIVLNAHMDTIGADGFEGDPFGGRREGDVIHGRGASDCKGGLVAGVFALRALRAMKRPPRCAVIFESVVDEECNGGGAGTLACCLGGIGGDYALVLDGSFGLLYTGCQGVATVELTVRGRAGHGSTGGVSAIEKLLRVAGAVDALRAERARTAPGVAVNLGVLRAGSAPWTVPDRGLLVANLNYARGEMAAERPGAHGAAIRERLEARVAEACRDDDWLRAHPPGIEWVKDLPGFGPEDAASPAGLQVLVDAAREAWTAAAGRAPNLGDLPAWGDAAHLARTGRMAVLGMGAGEPGTAHTASEFNRVSNVRATAAAVAMTVARLAATGPAGHCVPPLSPVG